MRDDAALDGEDDALENISRPGVRIGLDLLKEWLMRHITKEPLERWIMMVKRSEKFSNLNEVQPAELPKTISSSEESSPRTFMKIYRKMAKPQIASWTQTVEELRVALSKVEYRVRRSMAQRDNRLPRMGT
jgi:hypothetical protein